MVYDSSHNYKNQTTKISFTYVYPWFIFWKQLINFIITKRFLCNYNSYFHFLWWTDFCNSTTSAPQIGYTSSLFESYSLNSSLAGLPVTTTVHLLLVPYSLPWHRKALNGYKPLLKPSGMLQCVSDNIRGGQCPYGYHARAFLLGRITMLT